MVKKTIKSNSSEFPILDGLGLYPAPTKGDGNCLFRALSDQLYGDETHHAEVRENIVRYVKQHKDHFAAFVGEFGETFDQYIVRLAQDGVYGGHIEIVGFAEHFGRPVVIYQADTLYIVEPQNIAKSEWKFSVHIAYHTWEHYSSVRKVGGPKNGPAEISIPRISDIPGTSGSADPGNDEVPSWKIDIVLKSVPDAKEDIVSDMLRTKDYDQVIEELIMKEHETGDDPPPEEQDVKNTGSENEYTDNHETGSTTQFMETVSTNEAPSSQASSNISKKELAKQRRAEKKERMRAKKTKGSKCLQHKVGDSTTDQTRDEQNAPDPHKIILI